VLTAFFFHAARSDRRARFELASIGCELRSNEVFDRLERQAGESAALPDSS
jgi:hypothetical protein